MVNDGTPGDGTDQTPGSLYEVRVGDRLYPVISRANCRTCQHPDRRDIEHKIMSGYSYASIAVWAADQESGSLPPPGENALRTHAKAHMAIAGAVQRAVIDRREAEGVIDANAELAADHITLTRLVLQRGMEGLADGTLKPDMPDVLAAAKFLATYDTHDNGPDVNAWRDALMAYMEIARVFIPDDRWSAFASALAAHPTLRKTTPAALPAATERTTS